MLLGTYLGCDGMKTWMGIIHGASQNYDRARLTSRIWRPPTAAFFPRLAVDNLLPAGITVLRVMFARLAAKNALSGILLLDLPKTLTRQFFNRLAPGSASLVFGDFFGHIGIALNT